MKSPFSLSLLLIAVLFLSSCAHSIRNNLLGLPEVSPLPSDLRKHARPSEVRAALGDPNWTEAIGGSEDTSEGTVYIWHYSDRWWDATGWGSWTLYFRDIAPVGAKSKDVRLAGWRFADPMSSESGDREVFTSNRTKRVSHLPWDR